MAPSRRFSKTGPRSIIGGRCLGAGSSGFGSPERMRGRLGNRAIFAERLCIGPKVLNARFITRDSFLQLGDFAANWSGSFSSPVV